ncbi:Permease of the drug/metabolite transporter (DMT) superfamily [hydrothermal vent metagenome]|uniref:Permease of the drug/metabolite transporter (DMT) superfamily n=1 Tax=hydrothermal vent metagenome TaxID=652676 RepID=A0A3B1CB84_9ZZZZ
MEYLTVEEVAKSLKIHMNTVYKMCRQGTIPAIKMGKEWRVDRHEFIKLMKGKSDPVEAEISSEFIKRTFKKGHLLGVFPDKKSVLEFEIAYFLAASKEKYRFFKACWWQHPDDIRHSFAEGGLPVETMEADGSLIIESLSEEFEKHGAVGAAATWLKATTGALEKGYKGLVGAGSPGFDCCGEYSDLLGFENSLGKMLKDQPVMGVCSYVMDMKLSGALSKLLDLIKLHDRFFIYSNGKSVIAEVSEN